MRNRWKWLGLASSLSMISACGGRDGKWEAPFERGMTVGLSGSVAVMDPALRDVLFLSSSQKGRLETLRLPTGDNVRAVQASKDGKRLFVLAEGNVPRRRPSDESPALRIFSGGTKPKLERKLDLDDPMGALSLDPMGEWAVAFAGNAAVTNPNELVFVDLKDKNSDPRSKTLRSFGGAPRGLLFTDTLTVPEGDPRRFLVVRTDRDLALLDLSDLGKNEVTIQLPKNASGSPFAPEQVVFDDGEPDDPTDARIAVRLVGSSDVVLCELGSPTDEGKDYSIRVNIMDVGGIPSAIEFVQTDAGLRLAALVPGTSRATLVDPETTATETVDLGAPFTKMSRITGAVDEPPSGGDVALLWGGNTGRIAFWSLGSTSGTPYRSVDATDLNMSVTEVLDVAPPNGHLKILRGDAQKRFFVLDLQRRESFPLETNSGGYSLSVARDGGRIWALPPAAETISMIDLEDLHPSTISTTDPVGSVFDIERGDGGRSAVLLHDYFGLAATLLDAFEPDPTEARYFPNLHLVGLE
jgi:hypothetical protein